MRLNEGLAQAQTLGLDLVEVAPTANSACVQRLSIWKIPMLPNTRKIKKPGKFETEGNQVRRYIDEHDYLTKVRHAEEFLDRGNKVRVQLQFLRPRNGGTRSLGIHLVKKVRDDLSSIVAGGNRPEDRRSQYHHDPGAFAANRRKRNSQRRKQLRKAKKLLH